LTVVSYSFGAVSEKHFLEEHAIMSEPIQPIKYDSSGCIDENHGITRAQLSTTWGRLNHVRQEIVEADEQLLANPSHIPSEKEPLDAGFFRLPERIRDAYVADREESELGRIFQTVKRLRDQIDRVVVLGIGGSYMGARALMDACREPYYNELSRGERGSYPRMYFEGNNVDNDAAQGLLKLLGNGKPATSVDDRWAIVVISKSGGTLETAVAFRRFLDALKQSCSGDKDLLSQLVVPVTGETGKLRDLSAALGCPDVFDVPDGVGGRFSVLSPVGLLPAALLGLNVVRLLEGAIAMNEHFCTAPPEENIVLQYVAACHLLEKERGVTNRVLCVWSKALEGVGLWYDQLLAESLGKEGQGAMPVTAVNTRDLHSRHQQHQEGRRDKLFTNVIVDNWRTDPLAVGHSELNQDTLNDLAEKTLPDIMTAAIQGTNEALKEGSRPTANINLPDTSEASIGQLLQMLMLATVVEGRLLGINPYGQPGVESYKKNMNRILGRG
jgi:glucose-6-phosphate isomerase